MQGHKPFVKYTLSLQYARSRNPALWSCLPFWCCRGKTCDQADDLVIAVKFGEGIAGTVAQNGMLSYAAVGTSRTGNITLSPGHNTLGVTIVGAEHQAACHHRDHDSLLLQAGRPEIYSVTSC